MARKRHVAQPAQTSSQESKSLIPNPYTGISRSTLPAESQSRPLTLTFVNPTDVIGKYLEVSGDLLCRRALVWHTLSRSETFNRIIMAAAGNIQSRHIQITRKRTTTYADQAIDRVRRVLRFANGQTMLGWPNMVYHLLRCTFGSVTGAFLPVVVDELGRIQSIKILDPMAPMPYYESEIAEELDRLYRNEQHTPGQCTGIWYRDGSLAAHKAYVLNRTQYVQAVMGSIGVGAFMSGLPAGETSLWSVALETSYRDALRHGANANDPAAIVVMNNVDMNKFKAAIDERQEAIEARERGERVDEEKLRRRIVVVNQARDIKATVEQISLRQYGEGIKIGDALSQAEETIGLNLGFRNWRAASMVESARFGNATNVALLNADEPGMRMAETIVGELIDLVIGPDRDVIDFEFAGVDNARATQQVDYESRAAQTAVNIGNIISKQAAADYLIAKRIVPEGVRVLDDTPAPATPPVAEQFAASKAIPEDWLRCTEEATRRYNDWVDNELPTVVDRFGVDRSELRIEVRDITNELIQDIVRCAQRYGSRDKSTRMRLYYDNLVGRFGTLFGIDTQRGPNTTQPKINLYNQLEKMGAGIASGRYSVQDVQHVARGFQHHIARYFRAASAAQFIKEFDIDYDGVVTWDLNDLADHCEDCPRIAGTYPNMRALLIASGGRYPRSLDLGCHGNCLCALRKGS